MEPAAQEHNAQTGGRRSNTRLAAVKALYAHQVNEKIDILKTPSQLALEIIAFYEETEGDNAPVLDQSFLAELIHGVCEHTDNLDVSISTELAEGWSLERLGPVMRAILRCGVFELMRYNDTPLKVILDEYVSIAQGFFDEKDVGFVNGILDKIAHKVRSDGGV